MNLETLRLFVTQVFTKVQEQYSNYEIHTSHLTDNQLTLICKNIPVIAQCTQYITSEQHPSIINPQLNLSAHYFLLITIKSFENITRSIEFAIKGMEDKIKGGFYPILSKLNYLILT